MSGIEFPLVLSTCWGIGSRICIWHLVVICLRLLILCLIIVCLRLLVLCLIEICLRLLVWLLIIVCLRLLILRLIEVCLRLLILHLVEICRWEIAAPQVGQVVVPSVSVAPHVGQFIESRSLKNSIKLR